MGVASCRSTFLCLMLSVRLVPFRISIHDLIPFSGRARRGFSIREVARPNPARPCAPLAPTPPMRSSSLSLSFGSPAQQPPSPSSTSLSPWCPRNWRRRSPEFGPRGELPSPSPLSLPLSSSLPCAPPSLSPARGGARPCPIPARQRRPPPPRPAAALARPPPPWPLAAAAPAPHPGPPAWPARQPMPPAQLGARRGSAPGAARRPGAA